MVSNIDKKYQEKIQQRLLETAEVKKNTAQECLTSILEASNLIVNIFKGGNKILICGNGGSAADSQHMAGELVCALNKEFERPGLPAISLSTDTSVITAYANDFNFEGIFSRQVQALGKPGDLLIGISTSGNSKNIIAAFKMAKEQELKTLALCGEGGDLVSLADIAISIPSNNTQYIQESLLSVEHIICEIVEEKLFNNEI